MRKVLVGVLLSIVASATYAQSTITFNIDFHTVYAASGSFAPTLQPTGPGPFNDNQPVPAVNLTGQIQLTAVASSTELYAPGPNMLTLNGSWTSESGWEPANTWTTHTYNNAVFDFGSGGGYVATDLTAGLDWPMQGATSDVDGLLSDYGTSASPCPVPFYGCLSPNPGVFFQGGSAIYDTGTNTAIYPGFADAGNHPLVSGTTSSIVDSTSLPIGSGLGSGNGIDALVIDMVLVGGSVPQPGGTVRFLVFSDTAQTAYMIEGTIVPVPAAVWLFGSALGLLGWMRRRATI